MCKFLLTTSLLLPSTGPSAFNPPVPLPNNSNLICLLQIKNCTDKCSGQYPKKGFSKTYIYPPCCLQVPARRLTDDQPAVAKLPNIYSKSIFSSSTVLWQKYFRELNNKKLFTTYKQAPSCLQAPVRLSFPTTQKIFSQIQPHP